MGTIVLDCQPGARQTRCVRLHDGPPKIQLQAAPVDGQANRALVAYIAQRGRPAPGDTPA